MPAEGNESGPLWGRGHIGRQLLVSHLAVAAIGVAAVALVIFLFQNVRQTTQMLARQHAPAALAATQLELAVDQTMSALRGYVLLGDESFRSERSSTWRHQVVPLMTQLRDTTSNGEQTTEEIGRLDSLLDDLHDAQWWVEDVAGLSGSEPARELLERDFKPIRDQLFSALDAFHYELLEAGAPGSVAKHLGQLVVLDDATRYLDIAAGDYVRRSGITERKHLIDAKTNVESNLALLLRSSSTLDPEKRKLLDAIETEFTGLLILTRELLLLGQSRGVAQQLLSSESRPLTSEVVAILASFSKRQQDRMQAGGKSVETMGNVALTSSLILLAALLLVAAIVSRQGAERFRKPLTSLVDATQALAAGEIVSPLQSSREDEFGELIEAFSEMKSSLDQRSTELLLSEERSREHAQKAEIANQAKSRFLANMSHEIRTPMNGVIGTAAMLAKSQLSSKQMDQVQTITSSSELLLSILDDILDLSKIEAGRIDFANESFSLLSVVSDCLGLVKSSAIERDNELYFWIDPKLPAALHGDPLRIRQILNNLLGNAIKFTRGGEVYIECIAESGEANQPFYQVRVSDNGVGISKTQQEGLFSPFAQADASTTRRFGGTGLGLTIVEQLTEAMGGRVWFESDEGRGSTFSFRLPLKVGQSPMSDAAEERVQAMSIMLIDDIERNRRQLEAFLFASGFSQVSAQTSEFILQGPPEALDGIELLIVNLDGLDCERSALAANVQREDYKNRLPILCLVPKTIDKKKLRHSDAPNFVFHPTHKSTLLAAAAKLVLPTYRVSSAEADPNTLPPCALNKEVLLVEDNIVNRKVATELLTELGAQTSIAANGQEAVEALRRHRFDIVLMDCQMPVLDGYDATRAIREEEEAEGRPRTLIVALTAHALSSEKQKCLAAGMDDHISKPISFQPLVELFALWFSSDGQDGSAASLSASQDSVVQWHDLRRRLDGNELLLEEIMDLLLEDLPTRETELKQALQQKDCKALELVAHSLKGLLGTISAHSASLVAARMVTEARLGNQQQLALTGIELTEILSKVRIAVEVQRG